MSKKKVPSRIESQLAGHISNPADYAADAGHGVAGPLGFPPQRALTEAESRELLKVALFLRDAQGRLKKMAPCSERNALEKAFRQARSDLWDQMIDHGFVEYVWPGKLRVRLPGLDHNRASPNSLEFSAP